MKKSTQIMRIESKIYKALKRILQTLPNDNVDPVYTPSQLANYILEWYIREMLTNGNDYIDKD